MDYSDTTMLLNMETDSTRYIQTRDRHAELDYVSKLNECIIFDGRTGEMHIITVVDRYLRENPHGLPTAIVYKTNNMSKKVTLEFNVVLLLIQRGLGQDREGNKFKIINDGSTKN